ncbi:MAG: histidinol-phosphate transaminase, partial [Tannerellaceae bacterium]
PYNRYPDPMQWALKDRIAELKGIDRNSIFLGNGSDEPIDLLIRAFCDPSMDCIVSIDPSYGMYQVSADVNGVECRKVQLTPSFELDAELVLEAADNWTKIIFLCSPNNPTGNTLNREEVYKVIKGFQGLVVIDEAYIDFSTHPSFLSELSQFPNLIILQTLSKAWGAAGIRLGMAFASPEIIAILNKIKYPYNINCLTQQHALEILTKEAEMKKQLEEILSERQQMEEALHELPSVRTIHPSDANFLLVNVGNANAVYASLVKKGIVVRNRTNVSLCSGCLRITIGTPDENQFLLESLKGILS